MAQRRRRSDWEETLRAVRMERGRPGPMPERDAQRPPGQIVVKVVGWAKSRRGVHAMLNYMAGLDDDDDHDSELRTPEGDLIEAEQIRAELDRWDLLDNQDNLTTAARKMTPGERSAMPERERLAERQAAHIVISLPPGQKATRQQMDYLAQEWLAPFQKAGFEAAYAIHDHQAQQHIHFALKARALDGSRLRLDPAQLDSLRVHAAHIGNGIGMNLRADQRVKQDRLYQRILNGTADLKPKHDHKTAQTAKEDKPKQTNMAAQSPLWHSHFGAEYYSRREASARDAGTPESRDLAVTPKEREQLRRPTAEAAAELRKKAEGLTQNAAFADDGKAARKELIEADRLGKLAAEIERRAKQKPPAETIAATTLKTPDAALQSPPKLPARSEAAVTKWAGQFDKPEEARRSFLYMAAENTKTAFWYANNRPEVFGQVKAGSAAEKISQRQVTFGPTREASDQYKESLKLKLSITTPAVEPNKVAEAQKRAGLAGERTRLENALIRLEKNLPDRAEPTRADKIRATIGNVVGRKPDPQAEAYNRLKAVAEGIEQPRKGDHVLLRVISDEQLVAINSKIKSAAELAEKQAQTVTQAAAAALKPPTPEKLKPMEVAKPTPIIVDQQKPADEKKIAPQKQEPPKVPNYRPTQAVPSFERDTPQWFANHGKDFRERQFVRFMTTDARSVSTPPARLSPEAEQKITGWAVQFKNPEAAAASFKLMMAENRRAAEWFANHKPEVFGNRIEGAKPQAIEADRLRYTNAKDHAAWRNKTLEAAEKPEHKIKQTPKIRR